MYDGQNKFKQITQAFSTAIKNEDKLVGNKNWKLSHFVFK